MVWSRGVHGAEWIFALFAPHPAPLRVVKITLANSTKKEESVRGGAGSIPRSRNIRNQSQIFSWTKQVIEKSQTNQQFSQQNFPFQLYIIIRKIEATQEIIQMDQIYKPCLSNQTLN
jgi:hypothetical protein